MSGSRFNIEYDSRVLRVSAGAAGVTRPKISQDGHRSRAYCLNCGAPGGAFEAIGADLPIALKGDPGFIYVCDACTGKLGTMPLHAVSFVNRL